MKEGVLKWFGHTDKINEDKMAGTVVGSAVDGCRGRGKTKVGMD